MTTGHADAAIIAENTRFRLPETCWCRTQADRADGTMTHTTSLGGQTRSASSASPRGLSAKKSSSAVKKRLHTLVSGHEELERALIRSASAKRTRASSKLGPAPG